MCRKNRSGKHCLHISKWFQGLPGEMWGEYEVFYHYRQQNLTAAQNYTLLRLEFFHSLQVLRFECLRLFFIPPCRILKNADCSAKVVRKNTPDEPVGVFCLRNSAFNVVE
ncbi:hypothetical protein CPB97_004548 [Podila verticillata]|nr:hypothetical protein CPB97_004548 [Podila verticillata]